MSHIHQGPEGLLVILSSISLQGLLDAYQGPSFCPNSQERKMGGKVSLVTSKSPLEFLVTPTFPEDMIWQFLSPQNLE